MIYKMMISDIDGTLVDDSQKITDENKTAIKEFCSRGGIFSLATGRIEDSAAGYLDELSINCPVILYNGAKIVDFSNNSVIFEKLLTKEQAQTAAFLAEKYPVSPVFYIGSRPYIKEMNETLEIYSKKDSLYLEAVSCYSDLDLESVSKILFIGDRSCFSDFMKEFESICRNIPGFVNSEPDYLELLPNGVNKGTAVSVLSKYMNIPVKEIICIGDNLNDLEMIEFAGLGVAMENGHEKLKKLADVVAPPNTESGLAAILNKYTK